MRLNTLILLLAIFISSCQNSQRDNKTEELNNDFSLEKTDDPIIISEKDSPETENEITNDDRNIGSDNFETEYGTAVIKIVMNNNGTLKFFKNPESENPEKSISNNEMDLFNHEWLSPIAFYPEYAIFYFACFEELDNLYKVKIDHKNDEFLWLEKTQNTEYLSYGEYLKETFSVWRKNSNANILYEEPEENSVEVCCANSDMQFTVLDHKDYWINVETNNFGDYSEEEAEILKGWIQWRDKEEFLVTIAWVL